LGLTVAFGNQAVAINPNNFIFAVVNLAVPHYSNLGFSLEKQYIASLDVKSVNSQQLSL
jgi:hypothetical protein